jgi:hypothetical protein
MWGLWWTKWHWGRFCASISVSFANHFTDCSTLIIIHHLGDGTIGQIVADLPSGLSLTPPQETKEKEHWNFNRESNIMVTASYWYNKSKCYSMSKWESFQHIHFGWSEWGSADVGRVVDMALKLLISRWGLRFSSSGVLYLTAILLQVV